jgi:hypothetical protein
MKQRLHAVVLGLLARHRVEPDLGEELALVAPDVMPPIVLDDHRTGIAVLRR